MPSYEEMKAVVEAAACVHCGLSCHLPHDLGALMVATYSPTAGVVKSPICGPCSMKIGEFLCPGLIGDPEWVASCDQLRAHYQELGWWDSVKHG